MDYQNIIQTAANNLGLSPEVVKKAYESYWEFIRETIQKQPLKESLTEEDFNKLRLNFNIPSIGKLSCTYDRYVRLKKRAEYIKRLRNEEIIHKSTFSMAYKY